MPLVAPIIPNGTAADSAGGLVAKIVAGTDLAASFLHGFAAMSKANAQRKELELEAQNLQQNLEIAQDQHAIEREKIGVEGALRRDQLDIRRGELDYSLSQAAIRKDAVRAGLAGLAEQNQRAYEFESDARKFGEKLKLWDPKFRNDEPIKWAANVQEFKNSYGRALEGTIPAWIKDLDTKSDQLKVPLKYGERVEQVPAWQLVRDYTNGDAAKQKSIEDGLAASGMASMTTQLPAKKGDTRTTDYKVNPVVGGYLKQGQGVDWNKGENRVPEEFTMKRRKGVVPTPESIEPDLPVAEQPQASPETIGTPTETDKVIERARRALAKGAPRQAVEQLLTSKGIDPSQL